MFYTFMSRVVAPILRLLFRPKVEGLENVPAYGPLIIASNHLSFIDSFIIPLSIPRPVTYIAKAEYFEQPGLKGRFIRWFLTTLGHMPIQRGARRAAMGALEQALKVLENGGAFAIYPEGTRSRDGRLYRGRTGTGWLVLASGARVLPIGLQNTEILQPIGRRLPRICWPGRPRPIVRIGPVMDFSHYRDLPPAKARRVITDEIVETIQKLSGQDYAGVYNENADVS
ncbi:MULTISPECIES: lysophospholipid acyltransferase family protein [Thermomonospora]|uniref:Phospholipid/glycerol acyltransferase n=1 Tax=Thermomonospora curvata (strain ATCC 19995 / DSM 43183 / JCM 3096 / KCTC 9072 / NBRC 15933 / NCIMB 10081 / Henssen B9) TaxID=471852 RepID=D1AEH6_THECD|nr:MULTISPECIES: lysophospholipid acyltransferase family protein [Thermomonospora]ACY95792.1 phospholipid/glycerol acyltransferase [Thermomonospora curvata DSM 43183]PKK16361.1 MAG: 1-acyl-sn-glycerol-3-phosphate acyltransferase [Thermomonospora sp. CIF 1]